MSSGIQALQSYLHKNRKYNKELASQIQEKGSLVCLYNNSNPVPVITEQKQNEEKVYFVSHLCGIF